MSLIHKKTYITLSGVNVVESISHIMDFYDTWYFRVSERIYNIPDGNINHQNAFIGYRAKVSTIRRRLILAGCTLETVQEHFNDILKDELNFSKSARGTNFDKIKMMKKYPDVKAWILCLRKLIKQNSVKELEVTNKDLLAYMVSGLSVCEERHYYSPQDLYNFPCIDPNCWAVVLFDVFDDDDFCELNITDFLRGKNLTDFDDSTERYTTATNSYINFCKFYDDIYPLPNQYQDKEILLRLLFSSVISAVESYLGEILKDKVMRYESIKILFVENYSSFNERKKISISEIYIKLKELEISIPDELDRIIYHRLDVVNNLYKKVLQVVFADEYISELSKAIMVRHDIVHRNGKTSDGENITITGDMVSKLLTISKEFLSDIDRQVVDGFLY